MKRQLHLNLFIHSRGHHEASWRHPDSSPLPLTDIRYYQDLAQRAEAAKFDSIFLADQLALGGDVAQAARTWLEPITVLAAVAVATQQIGLIATCSTTYTEPFNLARQFASIDHISNGRAAWNIVTSWLALSASNFGDDGQVSHADRYTRGEEFMTVVKALWDSWAEDAVIDDRAGGIYAKAGRIRPINHRGEFYQVAGPLNMPRCPQGRPVLVQAGRRFAGRVCAPRRGGVYRPCRAPRGVRRPEAPCRRRRTQPEHVLILPGLSPMIASTEEAQRGARGQRAHRSRGWAQAALQPVRRARFLAPAARPLTPDFPDPDTVQAARSMPSDHQLRTAREANLRQLLGLAGARGHLSAPGHRSRSSI